MELFSIACVREIDIYVLGFSLICWSHFVCGCNSKCHKFSIANFRHFALEYVIKASFYTILKNVTSNDSTNNVHFIQICNLFL